MRSALPLLLVLFFGCTPTPPEDLSLLLEYGPYGVGYEEQTVVYGATERSLRLAIWYPTDQREGPEPMYYGVFQAPGVVLDSPISPGSFPLVVYSHGHQGYAESSGRILSHLVSHGRIVVAPDHTDDTFLDGPDRNTEIYWQRPDDLRAVLDAVTDPEHSLAGSLTDDPVLAMGHSFGGYSVQAWAGATFNVESLFSECAAGSETPYCSTMNEEQEARFETGFQDARVGGVVAMAPGDHHLFEDAGLGALGVPTLLMGGGLDDVEQADQQWSGLDRVGNYRVQLADAGHLVFTDFASVSEGNIDPERAWSVLGAYVVAFHRTMLEDDAVRPVWDDNAVLFGDTTTLIRGD